MSEVIARVEESLLMAQTKIAKSKRCAKPLYHAAKISDYRFRKVLWHFVRDHTATETARTTALSVNSVAAIFSKLRVFFCEVGLFTDIYEGQDPLTHHGNEPLFEKSLLEYHFQRMREKHGFKTPPHEPDCHFAETHWRYHFKVIANERPSEEVYTMMQAHLLQLIRLCGPVGTRPQNPRAGIEIILRQIDQRILWLERNAPGFSSTPHRQGLKGIREL
jgi:hypothetical protein